MKWSIFGNWGGRGINLLFNKYNIIRWLYVFLALSINLIILINYDNSLDDSWTDYSIPSVNVLGVS